MGSRILFLSESLFRSGARLLFFLLLLLPYWRSRRAVFSPGCGTAARTLASGVQGLLARPLHEPGRRGGVHACNRCSPSKASRPKAREKSGYARLPELRHGELSGLVVPPWRPTAGPLLLPPPPWPAPPHYLILAGSTRPGPRPMFLTAEYLKFAPQLYCSQGEAVLPSQLHVHHTTPPGVYSSARTGPMRNACPPVPPLVMCPPR